MANAWKGGCPERRKVDGNSNREENSHFLSSKREEERQKEQGEKIVSKRALRVRKNCLFNLITLERGVGGG